MIRHTRSSIKVIYANKITEILPVMLGWYQILLPTPHLCGSLLAFTPQVGIREDTSPAKGGGLRKMILRGEKFMRMKNQFDQQMSDGNIHWPVQSYSKTRSRLLRNPVSWAVAAAMRSAARPAHHQSQRGEIGHGRWRECRLHEGQQRLPKKVQRVNRNSFTRSL